MPDKTSLQYSNVKDAAIAVLAFLIAGEIEAFLTGQYRRTVVDAANVMLKVLESNKTVTVENPPGKWRRALKIVIIIYRIMVLL